MLHFLKFKENFKLFLAISVLCIIAILSFGLISRAASGTYFNLNGETKYDASFDMTMGEAYAYNKSGQDRLAYIYLKQPSGALIASNSKVVTAGNTLFINANISNYYSVYASCTVYNSSLPQSGIAETLRIQIR